MRMFAFAKRCAKEILRDPINLVFSGIFGLGYLGVWAVIYFVTKRKTERINAALKKQQQKTEDFPNG